MTKSLSNLIALMGLLLAFWLVISYMEVSTFSLSEDYTYNELNVLVMCSKMIK